MKEVYYKPSGRLSISFFPYFILLQVLAIPLLSVIYIYLIYYIPIVYFNFLFTLGCGVVSGLVMTGIINLGKVRNTKMALFFCIIAMCIMKYVQWCVYIPIVATDAYDLYQLTTIEKFETSLALLISPSAVIDFISTINEVGVWSIFTISFKGGLLTLVWLLEFFLMTATACFVSLERSKFPFCEEDGTWYVEMPSKIGAKLPENFDNVKKDLEKGDFDELIRLSKDYKPDYFKYLSLIFCKAQNMEHYYLKIKKIMITEDKGKKKTHEDTLVEYISIDNNSVREIQAAFSIPG